MIINKVIIILYQISKKIFNSIISSKKFLKDWLWRARFLIKSLKLRKTFTIHIIEINSQILIFS